MTVRVALILLARYSIVAILIVCASYVTAVIFFSFQKPLPDCQKVCGRYVNMRADGACFCLVNPDQMLYQRHDP